MPVFTYLSLKTPGWMRERDGWEIDNATGAMVLIEDLETDPLLVRDGPLPNLAGVN